MLLTAVNTGTLVSNESDLSGEKGTMLLSLVELLNIVDICQRISLFRMNWMIHREVNPEFFWRPFLYIEILFFVPIKCEQTT